MGNKDGRDPYLEMQREEIAKRQIDTDALGKEWVHDPTPQSPNRWVNTDTGEYRYQEQKPGEGGGDDDDGSDAGGGGTPDGADVTETLVNEGMEEVEAQNVAMGYSANLEAGESPEDAFRMAIEDESSLSGDNMYVDNWWEEMTGGDSGSPLDPASGE